MKEYKATELNTTGQSAALMPSTNVFRDRFFAGRSLPKELDALNEISSNFYWSWGLGGVELFRDIDPNLWDVCEQNPRMFLRDVAELRLLQKALDPAYVDRLKAFKIGFDKYLSAQPTSIGSIEPKHPVAYFCAEYGVHNSLPTYSGGLGILAGDHLKSASDLNVPLVAVGLLYRFGYFRQNIGHDGLQNERYVDIFSNELALEPVMDSNGSRATVSVHIRGREVFAHAWLARIGRISLYLLDTHVSANLEIDQLITGHLYGGSSETRIVQEKVLGIGGIRLLRQLGVQPSVFHLNEGHSAFLTLELAREFLAANPDATFLDAAAYVRSNCSFTTHTPVAAGNDVFSPTDLKNCFDARFISELRISEEDFLALGRVNPDDESEAFGMTPFAIRMAKSTNGVSRKHGEVSQKLWLKMFPDGTEASDVPIVHVTNGVHPPTWIAPLFQDLFQRTIGEDWNKLVLDNNRWAYAVDQIPDEAIWETHLKLKNLLIAYLRKKTKTPDAGDLETINEHEHTSGLFSPNVLTIGFARRVAAYKRWNLLLSDLDRLLRIVDHADRPVQFVFAGKAHPQDRDAKKILQELMSINHDSNWQKRAVFIEDYDQEVARYLVQGVDVWMNVPRRPHEASGTSGMKAAMNGALNFSVLDGWWIEGFNSNNGFSIGTLAEGENDAITDLEDAEALYSVLENEIIPAFYADRENGFSPDWIRRMKNAIATLTPKFSSDRMVKDYFDQIY